MAADTIAEAARAAGLDGGGGHDGRSLTMARKRLSADGRLVVTGTLYVVAEAGPSRPVGQSRESRTRSTGFRRVEPLRPMTRPW